MMPFLDTCDRSETICKDEDLAIEIKRLYWADQSIYCLYVGGLEYTLLPIFCKNFGNTLLEVAAAIGHDGVVIK